MMRRRTAVAAALIAATALPGAASADVFVEVPAPFLGGPIWKPISIAPTPEPTGRPSFAPPPSADVCQPDAPGCVIVGGGAEGDGVVPGAPTPSVIDPPPDQVESLSRAPGPVAPAMAPSAEEAQAAFGRLLRPRAADWLAWQRPVLSWRAAPRAAYYNVQIFRGMRRVMNAWSTDRRLRVPEGVLRQGRSYVWVVWPGIGPRANATYGPAVGRSTFAITLRPRLVFRASRGGVVAELRPHIPFARVRLYRPSTSESSAPRIVTLNARSLVRLSTTRSAAESLGALLVDRGPTPPVGLRGPGR
jgi:hypothetical protein